MTRAPNRDPDWARIPPHVPTYPNPPAFLRQKPAEFYTQRDGKDAYFRPSSKWHADYNADRKEEHYRAPDMRAPMMKKIEHQFGTLLPARLPPRENPMWRSEYLRMGTPESEAARARGLRHAHSVTFDKNVYQFSNAMTSTQYRKPVANLYGPMLRERVYGVNTQHNRHGFMNFQDMYY